MVSNKFFCPSYLFIFFFFSLGSRKNLEIKQGSPSTEEKRKYCSRAAQLVKRKPIASSFVALDECPKEPLEVMNLILFGFRGGKTPLGLMNYFETFPRQPSAR